jgi:hypothetical protein
MNTIEKDPNGLSVKDWGAKVDGGKAPLLRGAFQYFPRALKAVARLSAFGAEKYRWGSWSAVSEGPERYGDAMGRHIVAEMIEGPYDNGNGGSGELHATAVAWNALARLELILQEDEDKREEP